jgi:hypothetical protein
MTPNLLLIVLAAITVYRASRLITGDKVGEPVRNWAKRHSAWLAYLTSCDWCVSMYLGAAAAAVVVWTSSDVLADDWLWFVVIWFAVSGVTGFLSTVEQALDARARRDTAEAEALRGPVA